MKKLLLLLSLVALLPSCVAAVAGAGTAGYMAYRENGNDPVEELAPYDQEVAVEAAIEALEILRDVGTRVTNNRGSIAVREGTTALKPRVFKAEIDGNDVTVIVEAYDLDQSLVRVEVQTRMTGDQARVSRRVLDEILQRADALGR